MIDFKNKITLNLSKNEAISLTEGLELAQSRLRETLEMAYMQGDNRDIIEEKLYGYNDLIGKINVQLKYGGGD